jgi:hypothetical protein
MPIYLMRVHVDGEPTDEIVEVVCAMCDAPPLGKEFDLGRGRVGFRDLAAEDPQTRRPSCWPMKSVALGVGEHERVAAMKEAAELGVPTDFNKEGDAILTSPTHKRRLNQALAGRKFVRERK